MRLADLLTGVETTDVCGDPSVEVTGVTYDSRKVAPGSVFVAISGEITDGNRFVGEALGNGALVIVSEREPLPDVAWIRVPSGRVALAELAARFYDHPTRQLCLVGVTGTNGKTTTSHLIESILRCAGYSVALVGTIGHRGPGFSGPASLTTPEAPDLEGWFRGTVEQGGTHAVMEVSSHAIAMKRVWGLEFDVAVFTNLSGEHLDFHGGMEAYFETKRQLFAGAGAAPPGLAVVNADDSYGRRLLDCGNGRVITFGTAEGADVSPGNVELDWNGIRARFSTPRGSLQVSSGLIGRLNLPNVAAAVAVGVGLGIGDDEVVGGIADLRGVPGRFERVDRGQNFEVIVDYAHTDDALMKVLEAAREITPGRVIVVFGAGGERDMTKRGRMGKVASAGSDLQIVTSDNPRGEDPRGIIRMIEDGLGRESGNYSSIPDRRDAIREAVRAARPGDTVIIAGKGHEDYQIVGNERLSFDDRVVAAELLDELDAG
jgi:UDP-N-acetylmuramoyl-L-alanyl-D-glutamate--2,6-diaminopimelate ligase